MNNIQEIESRAFTVSDYVSRTNDFFKRLGSVLVKGEISQLSVRNHMYFSIKDENACVDCLMYANRKARLNFEPVIGQQVLIFGENSVYPKNGALKIIVDEMALAGRGQIMEQLRQLDQRLEREGVYANQRPLPRIMARVAVVTSVDGRVKDDIATNVMRRNPMVELIFFDTKVQGPDAPESILMALHTAYTNARRLGIDVIIIGRGGGSFEDLLCFSDERVVRMVALSPVPIISAVGHDEDRPLCDRSADLRVSTPTAAAETVTPVLYEDIRRWINSTMESMDNIILRMIDDRTASFSRSLHLLNGNNLSERIESRRTMLRMLAREMKLHLGNTFTRYRERIDFLSMELEKHGVQERLERYNTRLNSALMALESVPQYVLRRNEQIAHFIRIIDARNPQERINACNNALVNRLLPDMDRLMGALMERLMSRIVRCEQIMETFIRGMEQRIERHQIDLNARWIPEMQRALQGRTELLERRLVQAEYQLELGPQFTSDLPSYFASRLTANAAERINRAVEKLSSIEDIVYEREDKLDAFERALSSFYDEKVSVELNASREQLAGLISRLQALNPLYQLERGLSITTKDGAHSVKPEDIEVGDRLVTIMNGCHVYSTVTFIEPKELFPAIDFDDNL